jgi:outer membrane protein TolC
MNLNLPQYSSTVRERTDSAGVYFSVDQLRYSSNLRISQPLPTDGSVYVMTDLATTRDFHNDFRSANITTRFGISQPLDALYGYNSIRSRIKTARLDYERANKSLKRSELNLVYDVSRAYYQLLSGQKRTEYAYSDLVRQTEAHDISRKKFEAGLIREVEALQNEVELAGAQSTYDEAILNNKALANEFKRIIGLNLEDSVVLNSNLSYKTILIDTDMAIELALKNRLEIREQDIQMELQKLTIKQRKANGMARGTLNAYYEKMGFASSKDNFDILDAFDRSYSNFSTQPFNFNVAFSISIPILDWGQNRATVRAAEASLKRSVIQKEQLQVNIKTEIIDLVDIVNTNLRRLQLLERNIEVAQRSFDINLQRYTDGDIDSQALANERTRFNNAYSTHLSAYINYQLSLADLMRKTFYDFENDVPIE